MIDIKKYIQKAPKAELHTHLDGGLRIETLIEIAEQEGVKLPSYEAEKLRPYVENDDSCKGLVDYFKAFEITLSVMQSQRALERITYEYLEDCTRDGIVYVEFRFSPILHMLKGLSMQQVMEAVIAGKQRAEANLAIHSGIIVCGLRQLKLVQNEALARLAVAYKDKGVIAFDLAGEEQGNPAKDSAKAFAIAQEGGLHLIAHAGEVDTADSIRQAIFQLGAERIGHGTHLYEDKELWQYVIDHKIALEVCLSSNTQTKSVKNLNEHPFKRYMDSGVPIVLNTDSSLVSGTSLSNEYAMAAEHFNLSIDEIDKLIINAFEYSFMRKKEKVRCVSQVKISLEALKK